jgi:predicted O-methyltransferase YrrM
VVEVGSWKGRSTIWLAYGSRDGKGGTVFAVDPHAGSKDHAEKGESSTLGEFQKNVRDAGVGENVIPLVMTSEEAHRTMVCPIGLLFMDGPSEYGEVKAEMRRWSDCLEEGSILVIHDTVSQHGPRKVAESMYLSNKFADVRLKGSLTYGTVVGRASMAQKAADLRRLGLLLVETTLGRFHYPAPVRRLGRKVLNTLSK